MCSALFCYVALRVPQHWSSHWVCALHIYVAALGQCINAVFVCGVWCCKESQHKSVFWRNGFCVPTHFSFQLNTPTIKLNRDTNSLIRSWCLAASEASKVQGRLNFPASPNCVPNSCDCFDFCVLRCVSQSEKWSQSELSLDVFKDVSCLSVGTVSDGLRIVGVMFWNSWRKPSSFPILRHIIMGDKVSSLLQNLDLFFGKTCFRPDHFLS